MIELFLKNGKKAGLFDVCKWWIQYYPKDVFCTSPALIVQIRERMSKLLNAKSLTFVKTGGKNEAR